MEQNIKTDDNKTNDKTNNNNIHNAHPNEESPNKINNNIDNQQRKDIAITKDDNPTNKNIGKQTDMGKAMANEKNIKEKENVKENDVNKDDINKDDKDDKDKQAVFKPATNAVSLVPQTTDIEVQMHKHLIKSDEHDKPSNFCDFMFDFDKVYNKIMILQLNSIKLPKIKNLLKEFNTIKISVENNEKHITLDNTDTNEYNITDLLKHLNEKQKDVVLYLDPEEHIVIKGDNNFDIISNHASLLKKLGFTKSGYVGKSSYRSESVHSIRPIDKIYLFIESENDPILDFGIDLNENYNDKLPITKHFNPPISEMTELFIKFKLDNDIKSSNYVDFNEEPNELDIRIGVTK